MESQKAQHYFFVGLLATIVVLNSFIFLPYFGALLVAATLAVVFGGWHSWVSRLTLNYPSISSLITILLIFLVTFVPLSFLATLVFQEAQDLYAQVSSGNEFGDFLKSVTESVAERFPIFGGAKSIVANLQAYIASALEYIVKNLGALFTGVAGAAVNIFVALLALFFFLRDGGKLREAMVALSPLRDQDDTAIFNQLEKVTNSVVKGALLISLAQGIIAGLGYFIFGVPNPALLGAATVLTALIPGIGTAIILIPAVIYLWFQGEIFFAVALLLWGMFIVGLVDNYLKPKLIAREVGIHPFLILLSALGGLSFLGIYGFLLGPLLLSFLFALIELYKKGLA